MLYEDYTTKLLDMEHMNVTNIEVGSTGFKFQSKCKLRGGEA